jgi:hypothetical protein
VYHPQYNGAIERANGLIFSGTKKCLFDQKKGKWVDAKSDLVPQYYCVKSNSVGAECSPDTN